MQFCVVVNTLPCIITMSFQGEDLPGGKITKNIRREFSIQVTSSVSPFIIKMSRKVTNILFCAELETFHYLKWKMAIKLFLKGQSNFSNEIEQTSGLMALNEGSASGIQHLEIM